MNREEGKTAVATLIGNFCVDDVVCWVREFCIEQAEEMKLYKAPDAALAFERVAYDLAQVRNRGV